MATEPAPTTEPPAEATLEPTASPAGPTVEEQIAELRDSDMWLGLAEWDRASERGRFGFYWASTGPRECGYGEFSNQAEVWNDFAPQLRDELLQMVVEEGIEPETLRFRGSPIQDGFVSGVLPWWGNGPTGSQGRGTMFSAQASYFTADGESRVRRWPVLIGHGLDPERLARGVLPRRWAAAGCLSGRGSRYLWRIQRAVQRASPGLAVRAGNHQRADRPPAAMLTAARSLLLSLALVSAAAFPATAQDLDESDGDGGGIDNIHSGNVAEDIIRVGSNDLGIIDNNREADVTLGGIPCDSGDGFGCVVTAPASGGNVGGAANGSGLAPTLELPRPDPRRDHRKGVPADPPAPSWRQPPRVGGHRNRNLAVGRRRTTTTKRQRTHPRPPRVMHHHARALDLRRR